MILIGPQQCLFTKFTSDLRIYASVPLLGLAAILLLLSAVLPAHAQLFIYGREVGPDVVFTISGSFDPGDPDGNSNFGPEILFRPSGGEFEAWQTSANTNRFDLDAIVPFGEGGESGGATGSGDNFALFANELFIDSTYVPGTAFNTTLTFAGETLLTLGVDVESGPYVWTLTNSGATMTMQFTPPPAPPVVDAPADNSALRANLAKKTKKFKKKAEQAKRKGQSAKAKRFLKKAKRTQRRLRALG